jgi:hypothetical protein
VLYGSEDEASASEDFDRRGFFIGAGAGFAGENFSDRPLGADRLLDRMLSYRTLPKMQLELLILR